MIEINGLRVKELQEEELYTYLGQDEAVGYNGPLNKEKVIKEYKRRVHKIWTSELYSGNKITAHNTFSVPLITPTIRILNWTMKEIEDLDKATRWIMCYAGNLHMRSFINYLLIYINRIYVPRIQGGRGLASIEDTFTSRIVALANHIEAAAISNPFLEKVKEHEQNNIIRLRDQLLQYHDKEPEGYTKSALKTKLKRFHLEARKNKPLHSYIFKKIEEDNEIDKEASHQWLHSGISSHVEGYINTMQEQEIATKAIQNGERKTLLLTPNAVIVTHKMKQYYTPSDLAQASRQTCIRQQGMTTLDNTSWKRLLNKKIKNRHTENAQNQSR